MYEDFSLFKIAIDGPRKDHIVPSAVIYKNPGASVIDQREDRARVLFRFLPRTIATQSSPLRGGVQDASQTKL